MQKITPYLWYDKEAIQAAEFYVALFEDSKIIDTGLVKDTPSGDTETIEFELAGTRFSAISAGPFFKLNPSVSLMVACSSKEEVDRLYNSLSVNGTDLMALREYPFSKRYAWVEDKYGLSWQLMLTENADKLQKIRPVLLFSGGACGRAQEAVDYYVSVFKESRKGFVSYYAAGEAADVRAKVNYSEVEISGNQFVAMDHGYCGDFTFNEAFSFMIPCENQQQIDYYWDKLSRVPAAEQCGWVKDQFGLSWQIVPEILGEILRNGTGEEVKRVTQAFLKMKKLDIAAIEKARRGT